MLPTSGCFGALGILVGKDFQISREAVDAADRGGGGWAKAEHHHCSTCFWGLVPLIFKPLHERSILSSQKIARYKALSVMKN